MNPGHSPVPSRVWHSLSEKDHQILDRLLANEADMAYRRRARILLDYLEIEDDDRIVDLGCGMGFYLMVLGRLRSARRVGLERDLHRLDHAKGEVPQAGLVCGVLEDLPFPENSVDKILLSEVLEHVQDDVHVLRQIYRILKPGGILSISVPNSNYPFSWDPIGRFRDRLGLSPLRTGPLVGIWTNHERLYGPKELTQVLQRAGFVIEVLEESTHFCFPFSHFIVYGIGKPLFERDLLPGGMRRAADRFSAEENTGSMLNPVNLGVSLLRWFDRVNDRPTVADRDSYVNVLVKARKPLQD